MPEYGFFLICIFLYKDRFYNLGISTKCVRDISGHTWSFVKSSLAITISADGAVITTIYNRLPIVILLKYRRKYYC